MPHEKPVFRAGHVGSLLRPAVLRDARARFGRGEILADTLRAAEDDAIRTAVRLQEEVGLGAVTDGEFRRSCFHIDFLERIGGINGVFDGGTTRFRKSGGGELQMAPPRLEIVDTLAWQHPIAGDDFDFLKSVATGVPKVTIPSPSMAHFRGERAAISLSAYPEIEGFFADLAAIYRQEIGDLAARGCRYVQLDDTNLAHLCDPDLRERARRLGEDPDALPSIYARLINRSIADAPRDMLTAIHLCRGNCRSAFVGEGGYDPVAETLFNEIAVDTFFLEYDDARSGDFSPLRFVPPSKTVVLGLVSSKSPALEPIDLLKRRIADAARFVPLEQLSISPQCGFSPTEAGNDLTLDDQRRKLERVVHVAEAVWGSA